MATALHGQGNVVFLGGPPANSQSLEEYQGLQSVFKNYPGIHIIGQKPYNVTNWDPAMTAAGRGVAAVQVPEDRRRGQ